MAPGSLCTRDSPSGGTLEAVFHALSGDADMENLSVDSTCVKVHESANGGEKNSG